MVVLLVKELISANLMFSFLFLLQSQYKVYVLFLNLLLGLLQSIKGDEILKLRMWVAERGIQLCQEQSKKVFILLLFTVSMVVAASARLCRTVEIIP